MTIRETIASYGGKTVELTLDNSNYEVFKRLLAVTKEYADHEAEVWGYKQQPREHLNAIHHLNDVCYGFDHYDVYRDEPIMIPGDAAIFLTRRKHMATMSNTEFMRTSAVEAIIAALREELGIPKFLSVDGQ